MNEHKSLLSRFVNDVLIGFAVCIITVSAVCWLSASVLSGGADIRSTGGFMSLGQDGLSYISMVQLLVFALLLSLFKLLFMSNPKVKKMRLLWSLSIFMIFSYVMAIVFAVFFRWFPVESSDAWLGFIISLSASYTASVIIMIAKTKWEDKKYQNMLYNYKEKQKKESGDN